MTKLSRCIVIGGSTASPRSILSIVSQLRAIQDKKTPPIIIALHISKTFIDGFAKQISSQINSAKDVVIAHDGMIIEKDKIYLIPKTNISKVIVIDKKDGVVFFRLAPANNNMGVFRPNIDVLFSSAASVMRRATIILLSGIGNDGTQGVDYASKKPSTSIYIQDPSETIANGMLVSAESLGVSRPISLLEIRRRVLEMLRA